MKKKDWPEQIHILIASAILFALLILVCQIAERHNRRIDLTRERRHSISKETIEVLQRVAGGPIRVHAFFAEGDEARREFTLLLKEMSTHHGGFRYEFYDPDRTPSEAKRFRVDAYRTVVVEYEKREERFTGFSEEDLTNALIRLAHPKAETLCFSQGHGEISLSDTERTGFSEWKRVLEDYHYRLQEIQFTGDRIPAECNALVIAGPRYELLPKELDLLHRYPMEGRGILLLIDPMDPGTGTSFQRFLEPFGIELGDDVVIDKVSRIFGGDYLIPLIGQYEDHPITQRFRAATFLPIARTVRRAARAPENVTVTELAFTHPGSWAETDLKRLEEGEAALDPKKDSPGPVPVAAAVELQEVLRGGRMVVVGDSDFLTNANLGLAGNKDFVLNAIQWLIQDDRWISIRVKRPQFEPLFLKVNQSVGVALFSIGALPLAGLAVGSIGILARRRSS